MEKTFCVLYTNCRGVVKTRYQMDWGCIDYLNVSKLEFIPSDFILIEAELLTTNKLSELACLALYLMYEKKQGKKSFWYPYIRELDRQRGRGQLSVESPLLWSKSELDYLSGSPVKVRPLSPHY